jgi:hypothetical protein
MYAPTDHAPPARHATDLAVAEGQAPARAATTRAAWQVDAIEAYHRQLAEAEAKDAQARADAIRQARDYATGLLRTGLLELGVPWDSRAVTLAPDGHGADVRHYYVSLDGCTFAPWLQQPASVALVLICAACGHEGERPVATAAELGRALVEGQTLIGWHECGSRDHEPSEK